MFWIYSNINAPVTFIQRTLVKVKDNFIRSSNTCTKLNALTYSLHAHNSTINKLHLQHIPLQLFVEKVKTTPKLALHQMLPKRVAWQHFKYLGCQTKRPHTALRKQLREGKKIGRKQKRILFENNCSYKGQWD